MQKLTDRSACYLARLSVLLMVVLSAPAWSADLAAQRDELIARRRLVESLESSGRFDEALVQARQNLAAARSIFGNDHRDVALSLDRIASILRKQGQYGEAERSYQQALQMVRRHQQEAPLDVAAALQNLGGLYRGMGRYRDAEQHYREALRIANGVSPQHQEYQYVAAFIGDISDNLAVLYRDQGRYAEAEPLVKAAVERTTRAAQPDRLSLQMNLSMDRQQLEQALQMMNLANLYLAMKRINEAERLVVDALAIQRRILGDDDPRVAQGMHNLASLYVETDRLPQAEPLLQQAITTALRVYGPKNPEVAIYLDTLASLYRKGGAYERAKPFAERAVMIAEATLGPAHGRTALLRNNLAVLYLAMENYPAAELLLRETLADSEANLGPHHPELSAKLTNLAEAVGAQGRHLEVHQLYGRALAIEERTRDDLFQLLSEEQKLAYLQERMIQVQYYLLHAGLLSASAPAAVREAFEVWLRWKGVVMESQGRYQEALAKSDDPALQTLFDSLTVVRRELAGLRLRQPAAGELQRHLQTITSLEERKNNLEGQLSRASAVYARARSAGQMDSAALGRLLPKGTAYLDIALVRDWQFQPLEFKGWRYLAFLYRPDREKVELIDLGRAQELEPLVAAYREEIGRRASGDARHRVQQLDQLATGLYQRVITPLTPYLNGVSQLVISPDGALHLVPFEVFKGPDQRYLIERYALRYLPSGRDLARLAGTARHRGDALILSDPDYDLQLGSTQPRQELVAELQGVRFNRLPDTRREADAIAGLMRGGMGLQVRNLSGAAAREHLLFDKSQPALLHLATHGFFLHGDAKGSSGTENRGLKAVLIGHSHAQAPAAPITNPMLRSGIALAGVNRALQQGGTEGLVTAEKILGMRLLGTDLVTLSACETGVGDLQAGEGVFGLKRAFILAGARSVVLSLWSVPSRETTELMTEFYRQMAAGVPKATALRQAQLALLRKYSHPFYWGAFVLVGSPD